MFVRKEMLILIKGPKGLTKRLVNLQKITFLSSLLAPAVKGNILNPV